MSKIGISVGYDYNLPMNEVINLIYEAEFDAISPVWVPDNRLSSLVNYARYKGLIIQSLHAPFGKCSDLWSNDETKSTVAVTELLKALDDCATLNIPILVCHAWIGFNYTQEPNKIGLNNFQTIVDKAKELKIKIAFENTEGEEFLFALFEHFKSYDNVGFCWDSGHEMCYNHSDDLLEKLGNLLIMTHLNDNLGISDSEGKIFWTDDLHLLPLDGIADWDNNVKRLKNSSHLDILNFELSIKSKPNRHENDKYMEMSLNEYFTEAYNRARKIADAYETN